VFRTSQGPVRLLLHGTGRCKLGVQSRCRVRVIRRTCLYGTGRLFPLFNLGIVKWQGKMDAEGAVAAWQKLLDSNPNYETKEKVQELIQQAKKH
jgi:hypothetical protein